MIETHGVSHIALWVADPELSVIFRRRGSLARGANRAGSESHRQGA
jgi:hypothetical protein